MKIVNEEAILEIPEAVATNTILLRRSYYEMNKVYVALPAATDYTTIKISRAIKLGNNDPWKYTEIGSFTPDNGTMEKKLYKVNITTIQ